MEYEIVNRPSFAELAVTLDESERLRGEAGSMVSHSEGVTIAREDDESAERLEEQSFRTSVFEAANRGTVTFAPPLPGDAMHYELREETLYVQSCSFLASDRSIELAVANPEERFFGGEKLFLLELSGVGQAFLSSYGIISVVSLDPGEKYVVDTGHVVAFEESVGWSLRRVEGLRSEVLGGAEIVCEFEGPGTIWTQSRSPDSLLSCLAPNLPSGET